MNFTGPLAGIGNSMLTSFGIQKAVPKAVGAAKEPEHLEAKGLPLPILLWLGARLPFVAFVVIMGMFTYMYHILPILPWFLVFLAIDFAVIVCWPSRAVGVKRRSFWDWAPMYSWALAIALAVLFGHMNYGILESWVNIAFLREYKNVSPTISPVAIRDAGVLTFEEGTHLDTQSAAGYKFWFSTFCAAPIVGKDPMAAPITFWAVGVGCCGTRGDFTCDSALDKTTRSAMPLRPHNLGPEIVGHYNHAIRMSAASNDLEVAKEPVFVMWHKDPKGVGAYAWWLSTSIFLLLILFSLCACCACQSGIMHISVMQQ